MFLHELTVDTRREKERPPTTLVAILNLRARSRGHASTNQTFFASELSTLPYSLNPLKTIDNNNKLRFWPRILKNLRLKNPEQLQYRFICFYTFASRSFGLAPTAKNIMKVDSLRSHVVIVVTLLLSVSCFLKNSEQKEVKNTCMKSERTRNGIKWVGKLYSLTEAL